MKTLIKTLKAGASSLRTNNDNSVYPKEYECLPIQLAVQKRPMPNRI